MSIKFFNRNKSQGLYGQGDIAGEVLRKADQDKIFMTTDTAWNERKTHEKTNKDTQAK